VRGKEGERKGEKEGNIQEKKDFHTLYNTLKSKEKGGNTYILNTKLGVAVGDLDVELVGTLDDGLSLGDRDGRGDLGSVLTVVHQKELKVVDVENAELEETVGHDVTVLLVGSVTNVDKLDLRLESSADTRVNTTGSAPLGGRDAHEAVALVAKELLGSLLYDLVLNEGGDHSKKGTKEKNTMLARRTQRRKTMRTKPLPTLPVPKRRGNMAMTKPTSTEKLQSRKPQRHTMRLKQKHMQTLNGLLQTGPHYGKE